MNKKYKTVYINTIDEVKDLFFDMDYREDIGRYRKLYVYRGLPNPSYELITSLQRICKDQKNTIEHLILNNFAKYAELENPSVNESVWKQMIIGQHHGLPTRLLDWSASPLMALHFAMTEGNLDELDQHDCVVWRLDVKQLNLLLPEKYTNQLKEKQQAVFTIDMLKDISLEEYDHDMGKNSMVILEPPTIDMRIANQYSFFSIVPEKVRIVEDILNQCEQGVVKYVISRNLRWQIRDMLDQVNISERTVYPGLDGIASWLSRHYYVRRLTRLNIITRNIAKADVDVIVNPANRNLVNAGGTGKAIFARAGSELNKEIEQLTINHDYDYGELVSTDGYQLSCKKIYHAVTPIRDDRQESMLENLYQTILERLIEDEYHSVAIPLLCSGINGCDKKIAWEIALNTCMTFLSAHSGYPLTINFYVLTEEDSIMGLNIRNKMLGLSEHDNPNDIDFRGYTSNRRNRYHG